MLTCVASQNSVEGMSVGRVTGTSVVVVYVVVAKRLSEETYVGSVTIDSPGPRILFVLDRVADAADCCCDCAESRDAMEDGLAACESCD